MQAIKCPFQALVNHRLDAGDLWIQRPDDSNKLNTEIWFIVILPKMTFSRNFKNIKEKLTVPRTEHFGAVGRLPGSDTG